MLHRSTTRCEYAQGRRRASLPHGDKRSYTATCFVSPSFLKPPASISQSPRQFLRLSCWQTVPNILRFRLVGPLAFVVGARSVIWWMTWELRIVLVQNLAEEVSSICRGSSSFDRSLLEGLRVANGYHAFRHNQQVLQSLGFHKTHRVSRCLRAGCCCFMDLARAMHSVWQLPSDERNW